MGSGAHALELETKLKQFAHSVETRATAKAIGALYDAAEELAAMRAELDQNELVHDVIDNAPRTLTARDAVSLDFARFPPLFVGSCTLADRVTALGGLRCDLPSSHRWLEA